MLPILTAKQVIFRIAIIIALAELAIMLVLGNLHYELGIYSEALFDTLALIVLSTPPIYLWVIKPYIDARDEALEFISNLAFTDPLTQLANRRQLMYELNKAIASNKRHHYYGALLLIDLDDFKPINDQYGHDAGDAVLVETGLRLDSMIRAEDTVGRLGGDEFVVLLTQLASDTLEASEKALGTARRIHKGLLEPVKFKGKHLSVSASIGITLVGPESTEPEMTIKQADEAMYQAKGMGNKVVLLQYP